MKDRLKIPPIWTEQVTVLLVGALMATAPTGCVWPFVGHYRHNGKSHRMAHEQGKYLSRSMRGAKKQEYEWRGGQKTDVEILELMCEALGDYVANAPEPRNDRLVSAASLLEGERRETCELYEAKLEHEKHKEQRQQQALADQAAKESEYRTEAKRIEQERQVEEQRNLERKAKLQSTTFRIGPLVCNVVDYVSLGSDVGGLATKEASGVYVAALIRCANQGKKTKTLYGNAISLVDGRGRQYGIDTDGALYYTQEIDDRHKSLLTSVQHHPGVKVYSVAVFDVPVELARDGGAKLAIHGAEFPLGVPAVAE